MILKIKHLVKDFKQADHQIKVLQGLNLELREGETLAILGPSGSGKSTLLSLIAGLDAPTSGEVYIDGQNLNLLSEKELTHFRAQKLGIVFQQYYLFSHLTARENVALPLELAGDKDALAKADHTLSLVGLSHRANHFPHQMSGGENQRVAIGRAFVVKPRLLLADEPSGSLDTKTGEQVIDLLFDLVKKEKTTLILVTHNEELAKRCQHELRFNS
jgi:putative ABC transport system ATP-binding protein